MASLGSPSALPPPPPLAPRLSSEPDALSRLRAVPANDETNIFRNREPVWSRWQWARGAVVFLLFGGLLRALLATASVALVLSLSWVATLGLPPLPRGTLLAPPLSTARRAFVSVCVRPWLRVLMWALGVLWIEESGPAPRSKRNGGAGVLISNHVAGMLDGLYFLWRTGGCVVAEGANLRFPGGRALTRALEVMVIDRDAPGGAREAMDFLARSPAHPALLVFPEGSCSNGTALMRFKPGAFGPLVPVQGVFVSYPGLDAAWVTNGPSLGELLLRGLCSLRTRMTAQWMPARAPTPGELAAARPALAFASGARDDMAARARVPTAGLGLDDVRMAAIATAAHADPHVALVGLESLRALVALPWDDVKSVTKGFLKAGHGKRSLSFPEFRDLLLSLRKERAGAGGGAAGGAVGAGAAGVGVPPPASPRIASTPNWAETETGEVLFLRRLYDAFDADGDGELDLKEVLVGLALLHDRDNADAAADAAVAAAGAAAAAAAAAASGAAAAASGVAETAAAPAGGDADANAAAAAATAAAVTAATAAATAAAARARNAAHKRFLRLAFRVLDTDSTGAVSVEQLGRVLRMAWPSMDDARVAEIFTAAAASGGGGGSGSGAGASPEPPPKTISEAAFIEWCSHDDVFKNLMSFRSAWLF